MNKTSEYEFTVIIPVFNEAACLPALEERMASYLPECSRHACVLFVNDGSTDGSREGIIDICTRHSDFYYISFDRNKGLSAALKAGFDYCQSKFLGYIDADLQTAPEDFEKLFPGIDGCSMVIGIRAKRNDSTFKKMQSRIANAIRRSFTHDGATDTGCPLKLIRTSCAKQFPMFKGMHRFFPALVLLQEGGSFKQVEVRHFPRTAGQSKFGLLNRLTGPFADCFAYRWMKTRYIQYNVESSNLD